MMKKLTSLLLSAALMISLLACGAFAAKTKSGVRIAGLKGPTTMGLVNLLDMERSGKASQHYDLQLYGAADEIVPKLIKGELDMAAIPANLASVLYNRTEGAIQILAVNTLGVLYIVETGNSVQSLADLKGKTIYATGKGSTPEYTLLYLLEKAGLDPEKDVTVEFKSEPTEVVALLKAQPEAVAMLPQPYVTAAQAQVEGLRIAVDLNEAWEAAETGSKLLTGTIVVRREFAEANPEAIEAFVTEYRASTEFANENVSEAAQLVEKYGIATAAIAEKAIPYCNITCMEGAEMKAAMQVYLGVLYEKNPDSVGGALPDDAFYYEK